MEKLVSCFCCLVNSLCGKALQMLFEVGIALDMFVGLYSQQWANQSNMRLVSVRMQKQLENIGRPGCWDASHIYCFFFFISRISTLASFLLQHIPNIVTGIYTIGQRVIISDVQESLFWVRYRRNENQLIIFADDTYPRWVTTACLLDYDTMAAADKFGNISIVRYSACENIYITLLLYFFAP